MTAPAPLCPRRTLVAISDFREGWPPDGGPEPSVADACAAWQRGAYGPPPGPEAGSDPQAVAVLGGYLERLPLACVRAGLVEHAEIWHHWRGADPGPYRRDNGALARRSFRLGGEDAPFASNSMRGFVRAFGAPHILCVWGLGVDAALLDDCTESFRIYNAIDAPALRIPPDVAARFDLVLTAAPWQDDVVHAMHPGLPTAMLPIGPDFADPVTFRPLGGPKPYDVVYVAAAQPYKRHDILFAAMARAPRRLRALCVFGYGDMADTLRGEAAALGLDIDFVGPPGVDFAAVNRLMNAARIGIVCGVDDGAPAILTEYMLAGLPVLANAQLRCGLHTILPETGVVAEAADFGDAMMALIDAAPAMTPREAVLARWTWPHSVARLIAAMRGTPKGRRLLSS